MGNQKPELAAKVVSLATEGGGKMTDEECLLGRAVHAEARAAAAEHREAMVGLKAIVDLMPEVQQARQRVTMLERGLLQAQGADEKFRQQVGDRLGLDLSDPSLVNVNWDTGEVTLAEADADATPPA